MTITIITVKGYPPLWWKATRHQAIAATVWAFGFDVKLEDMEIVER